jgi:hypothetical protein
MVIVGALNPIDISKAAAVKAVALVTALLAIVLACIVT